MDSQDRKSLEDVRTAATTVAAWAGGIALILGAILWIDSEAKKSG